MGVLTHASFFTGAGGIDIGFERAGVRTVSVSEIDDYACRILRRHWPDVPNLGDINGISPEDIPDADIWSGGFPCQDLSLAGKRAGFGGKRSVLAFTFLDLVECRRPEWVVLENVQGLLTSNNGRDFSRLLCELDRIGMDVAWRVLDAKYFGVPQRRRRVFIVGSRQPDLAQQVLFECDSVCGHLAQSSNPGKELAFYSGAGIGDAVITTALTRGGLGGGFGADDNDAQGNKLVVSPPPYPNGVRAPDGMARRVDTSIISFPSRYSRQPTKFNDQADPLTISAGAPAVAHNSIVGGEDPLLPTGLDSARYRACGNGVVAPVAEWIARRIIDVQRRNGSPA